MMGTVIDRIEVKGRSALEYGAQGLIVIFKHDPAATPVQTGDRVLIVRTDGWLYDGGAEDVRFNGADGSSGFFLRGLAKEDVPIDSQVRWGTEILSLHASVA